MSDSSILHVGIVACVHKTHIAPDVDVDIEPAAQNRLMFGFTFYNSTICQFHSNVVDFRSSTLSSHLLIVDLLNLLLSRLLQGGSKRVEAQLWFHLQFFKVLQHQLRELLAFLFKLRSKRICLMVS